MKQEGNADGEETTLDEYATLDPWTLEPDSKPLRTMNVSTKEFLPKVGAGLLYCQGSSNMNE